MIRFSELIGRQSKILLENRQAGVLFAIIFAVLPFATWLSVALIALMTLRKGAKSGFDLLLPALVIHTIPLMMVVSLNNALFNTLIAYLPCYVAAITMRHTRSWQSVCGVFLLQAFVGALLFQILAPGFISEQFNLFQTIMGQYPEFRQIIHLNTAVWAQLFFGIQIISVVISSILSLALARSIQAKLFMPGGFRDELLAFRSGRTALLVFVGVSAGSCYNIAFALNLLPLTVCYFLISGFSLVYFIFARKRQFRVAVLLLLLILPKPAFVLFAYVIIGSLDSIFNFRLYLPSREREST